MSGWEVCASLKADSLTTNIPIVILTAAASPTLAQEAERAGCAAHLLKPCYPSDLAATVDRVLTGARPSFGV
jgi:CheY-like chemotaxis protein